MKLPPAVKILLAALVLSRVATPAGAHRLDEFLQATTLSLARDRVDVRLRLTPGVDLFYPVLAGIDTDGDGIISAAEQKAYAARVLADQALSVDGKRVPLRVVSATFPGVAEMQAGTGEILLELAADLPDGGSARRLVLENHHQSGISVYLVNCLVPADPDLHVVTQSRNVGQSFYQVDYTDARPRPGPSPAMP